MSMRFGVELTRAVLLGLLLLSRPVHAEQDAATPTAETITLKEGWLLTPGPGPRGRISLPVDRLEAAWIQDKLAFPDKTAAESPSAEGMPAWKRISANEQNVFSDRGLGNGWLVTYVDQPADGIWLLAAQGHGSVRVNGEPRVGDIYGNGSVELPIHLHAGTNTLIFAGSRGGISATLRRPEKSIYLSQRDTTYPHIIRGETSENLHGALMLVNATDQTQSALRLAVAGPGFVSAELPLPSMPPLSIRKVAFHLAPDAATADLAWQAEKVPLTLELFTLEQPTAAAPDTNTANTDVQSGSAQSPGARRTLDNLNLEWQVRNASQTHRRTFVSQIDGSVQYYGVVPPKADTSSAETRPGLFLSLHGAGVEGEGQAGVYAPKPNAYVIAPTNRRAFGFDWEDWGRWDALEVLELASTRFQTDPRRTYLTGHSMGGHGTWHIGTLFPDRFAAIGPSAGWISFASYAGGPQNPATDPLTQLLRSPLLASDTLARIDNLATQGVFILHGDQDDNVPVDQARAMREQLAKFHPDFVYKEQPGAGHWWGNACCDWPAMFAFFADHTLPATQQVDRIRFTTPGPHVSPKCYWATVVAPQKFGQLSRLDLKFDRASHTLSGTTENVARLAIQWIALCAPGADGAPVSALTFTVDDAQLTDIPRPAADWLWLERTDTGWQVAAPFGADDKTPARCGPLKEAFRSRFVMVYGTAGTPEENAWMLARARYDAETFWYRGNGSVDVIADTQWQSVAETDRSVIVFGNATVNSAWRELLGDGPITLERDRWAVPGSINTGKTAVGEGPVALWMIRPRPGSSMASVAAIGGTDLRAMRATNRVPLYSSGTGYPDLLIVKPDYLETGAAAVIGTGYFGVDWSCERGTWVSQTE